VVFASLQVTLQASFSDSTSDRRIHETSYETID